MNPLLELKKFGQSVWLDYIRRDILKNGGLKNMIEQNGISGVTSNPTIFDKAISGSNLYHDAMEAFLEKNLETDVNSLYEHLVFHDIRMAAEILKPVYEQTNKRDGFVSLEVSPKLAYDTQGTIEEAERLWNAVNCPNLMLKIPATPQGIPAIEQLLSQGININVTLMFSLSHYEAVANAYIRGLEKCANPAVVSSVASFFVSRVDSAVDKQLQENGSPPALSLCGKIAVANSRLVYKRFKEIFYGKPFSGLRNKGCQVQRPLWASTSTKNPAYPDILYVESLIGPDTVNTLPPATLEAYLDHGKPEQTVKKDLDKAIEDLSTLKQLGIDLDRITQDLQKQGVQKFIDSFDQLTSTLIQKHKIILAELKTS